MYPRDSKSSQRCCTWVSVSLREARAEDVALTDTEMTVDAGKTCRAHQLWIQGTTGVCLRLGCTALLHTHKTVLWLDVSVDAFCSRVLHSVC